MAYTLPPLPYDYTALEPYIDEETMHIHHDKHHQTYLDKLNAALASYPELVQSPIEKLLQNLQEIPEAVRSTVQNHGGGYFHHSFFWEILTPNAKKEPAFKLVEKINQKFGNFENFKKEFSDAAAMAFGSGWTWLSLDKSNELKIHSTQNQNSPLSEGLKPILTIDVWEHAYYLKYQNRRIEYIQAFWNIINWEQAEKNLLS